MQKRQSEDGCIGTFYSKNIPEFSITIPSRLFCKFLRAKTFEALISYYYSCQTYTELLNMGKYDSVKYSKVEDLGAQGEPPSEEVKTSTTGKKLGKWSSVR